MKEFTQKQISQFLHLLRKNGVETHAITIYQNDVCLLNRAYAPYEVTALHPLYSVSKSFLSAAVGYLVEAGKVDINKPWLDYCPAYADKVVDPRFTKVTVRNLLTMTLGQDNEAVMHGEDDWAENTVAKRLTYEPGTKFFYNSMCSHLLSIMVQTLTGEKLVDFLAPRLFAPLGIRDYYWEEERLGHNTGGFGLHLATQDLAKYGLCLLHHGQYGGKQVLPESWVEAATTKQMDNASEYPPARSENRQGYGYQFWMCTHGGFRCSGLHGQICFVQPENQLVIAMSNATTGSQAVLNCLFAAMDDPQEVAPFTDFAIPMPQGVAASCDTAALQGSMEALPNPAGITKLEWENVDAAHIKLTFHRGAEQYSFVAGYGEWHRQTDAWDGFSTFIAADSMKDSPRLAGQDVLFASYAWASDATLEIRMRALDRSAGYTLLFTVDRKYLTLHYAVNALYSPFVTFDATFLR